MKKFIPILFLIVLVQNSFCQSNFDKSLNEVSSDIAEKLNQKNKKKIVVLYVTDIDKSQTTAGKYIADIVSVNIVNDPHDFYVFDRENLSGIAEAKKLISEGYIDVDKVKELGTILSVEAIIIGNYTMLSNTLKLTLKAFDSNSGFVIAASMKDLPLNADAGALLGINVATNQKIDNSNRGFNNRPLNSSENYNNPETVNKDCKEKDQGDFCFHNILLFTVEVHLRRTGSAYGGPVMRLAPNQTQCFYNLQSGNFNYTINKGDGNAYYYNNTYDIGVGQIFVEQCKSKTFEIQ